MGPIPYVVLYLEGDYAILKRTDIDDNETVRMAIALLPDGIDDGTKLIMENFEYTIAE